MKLTLHVHSISLSIALQFRPPEFPSGFRHPRQSTVSCRCQKQPWTKMAFLRERNTRSGHPGKSLAWSRYRYPMAKTSLRISNSGRESLERTRAMTSERLDGGIVSTPSTFLLIAGRATGCPHYSTIKRSTTCANDGRNPLRNYGEMRDFRIGNWRAEEPASRASSTRKHNRYWQTSFRLGRTPPRIAGNLLGASPSFGLLSEAHQRRSTKGPWLKPLGLFVCFQEPEGPCSPRPSGVESPACQTY